MGRKNRAYFNMRYDEVEECLVVEATSNVTTDYMKMIKDHLWPEVEHMTKNVVDVISSNGTHYKNVNQYIIPAYRDRVDIFFDAAMSVLSNSIQKSIPTSNN